MPVLGDISSDAQAVMDNNELRNTESVAPNADKATAQESVAALSACPSVVDSMAMTSSGVVFRSRIEFSSKVTHQSSTSGIDGTRPAVTPVKQHVVVPFLVDSTTRAEKNSAAVSPIAKTNTEGFDLSADGKRRRRESFERQLGKYHRQQELKRMQATVHPNYEVKHPKYEPRFADLTPVKEARPHLTEKFSWEALLSKYSQSSSDRRHQLLNWDEPSVKNRLRDSLSPSYMRSKGTIHSPVFAARHASNLLKTKERLTTALAAPQYQISPKKSLKAVTHADGTQTNKCITTMKEVIDLMSPIKQQSYTPQSLTSDDLILDRLATQVTRLTLLTTTASAANGEESGAAAGGGDRQDERAAAGGMTIDHKINNSQLDMMIEE
eukprot:gene37959-46836_t